MNNLSHHHRKHYFPNGNLACSIKEFARMTNISRSALYEAIKEGSLIARKRGARTVITASDGLSWLDSLPMVHSPARDGMSGEIGCLQRRPDA